MAAGLLVSLGALAQAGAVELDSRLTSYCLASDAQADPPLQSKLVALDRDLLGRFGIPEEKRACGLLDLSDLRLAWIRQDELFYGASVPKICILLAYFHENPRAASRLDPVVRLELGRMIKRSSNEFAAKYSQLVGLEAVQRLQLSERYRLYEAELGGGLWSGKHYGKPAPRRGDPLKNLSHTATIRQCLRFYLMLEQGRLVSPEACRAMKRIFASPLLEFHDDNFVAGLRGRDVRMIRKNGLWEDWHLDTARIEHGRRVYLLAGMVEHPRGREYLAALAAGVGTLLCGVPSRKPHAHELIHHETAEAFRSGRCLDGRLEDAKKGRGVLLGGPSRARRPFVEYVSSALSGRAPFNEVLLSWNADVSADSAFTVELRVGRRDELGWSPYIYMGDWYTAEAILPEGERVTKFDGGKVDVDVFRSPRRWDRFQYRLRAYSRAAPRSEATLELRRVAVCLSDTTGLPLAPDESGAGAREASPRRWPRRWIGRLDVPFRSQKEESAEIAARICSPTSVAMVMDYRGVSVPTTTVARRIYDATHDIYGNWPRAIQGAYSMGVPGYLRRFADWSDVAEMLDGGQPLIISIGVKEGQLTGAPYRSTSGHLLVLTGMDASGGIHVNDPAAPTQKQGRATYRRDELDEVWLRRGGTAYVLLAPER